MAMATVASTSAIISPARPSTSFTAASTSSFASSTSLAPPASSLSSGSVGSLQARCSFQQFDGLRGEGSLTSLHSLCGISAKAHAFSVQASSAVAEPAAVAAPSKQKIRIKLRSYWVHLIQQACQQILEAAKNTNAETMGPVPLPTKKRIYCVLRSPHVDKDSREHFEIRTHHRLIDLTNPNAQTIDALMQLDLPAGVDVEVKLS